MSVHSTTKLPHFITQSNTKTIFSSTKTSSIHSHSTTTCLKIRADIIGYDPPTTIMIRKIPNNYSINDLAEEIDKCFANMYNFLYLPCDLNVKLFLIEKSSNLGYGFIKFLQISYLGDFYLTFYNYKWTKFRS